MVRVSPLAEEGLAFAATPDVMPLVEAEVLARAVAAWEPQDAATRYVAERAASARAGQDFLDLFQIEDARVWVAGPQGRRRGRDGAARHADRSDRFG